MNLDVYSIAFALSISCLVHATSTSIQKKRLSHQLREKRASNLLKKKKEPTEVHDIVGEVINQLGSHDALQSGSSQEQPTLQIRKKVFKPSKKDRLVLNDKTSVVKDVGVEGTNNDNVEGEEEDDPSKRQFILQLNAKFIELVDRGNYNELVKFSEDMESEVFLKHVAPLTNTLDCFKGFILNSQTHDITVYFFVHGDMDIVKKAITGYRLLSTGFREGNDNIMIDAIVIALKNDHYGRAFDLFTSRAILAAEVDKEFGVAKLTDFESFMIHFFGSPLPGVIFLSLKRLLTNYEEEFEIRCPGILKTICQELVNHLKCHLDIPSRANLLADLVAQTTLLTPSAYVNGFMHPTEEARLKRLYDFIEYGWNDVIEMGLDDELHGVESERLWFAIAEKFPEHNICSYPPPPDAIAATLKLFPTREQLKEEWIEKNIPGSLGEVNAVALEFVPAVIVAIIIEYAIPSWLDIEHSMPSADDNRIRDQILYDSDVEATVPDMD